MQTEQVKGKDQEKEKPEAFVQVAVITTSGSVPKVGFEKVPNHQKIKVFLEQAAKELKLVSTEKWIAKVDNKELRIEDTYLENGLSGEVSIDYGPREGGGGGNE